MEKSLDRKLARILADPSCRDFILADAKDADMAFGLSAPGRSPEHHAGEARFRTLDEYRQLMREIVAQGLVDIMLMSASSNEVLTINERLFDATAASRRRSAPTTRPTSGWPAASGRYGQQPSQPFRTATIDHIQCGKAECAPSERRLGADLGLYSVTFNNDVDLDRRTLECLQGVPHRGRDQGVPAFPRGLRPQRRRACRRPTWGGSSMTRSSAALAGVTGRGRPLFLKIVYHGPAAMEALARYDRSLVVGILGGSAGTTFDAFQMLWEAKKYGARVALYGRKINNAEHQLSFIEHLRAVADDQLGPDEAVKAYHGALQRLGIRPHRSLADDLQRTETASSYSGAGSTARKPRPSASSRPSRRSPPPKRPTSARCRRPRRSSGTWTAGSGSWAEWPGTLPITGGSG